jgi:type VI secretion system secreted protein VgrG
VVVRLAPVSYELSLSESPSTRWQVTRVWISEALNQPYHAVIDAETEADDADTDALLGCDAALTLSRGLGESRSVCGLVSQIDFLGYDQLRLMVRFHVVPAFEILRQRINSRIWQGLSVQAIIGQVLGEGLGPYLRGFDITSVSRGIAARDYCVQYRESDFAFVSRLLEEQGIAYEFTHAADARLETLVFRDNNNHYAELQSIDGTSEVPIILSNPGEADVESIQTFEWSKQLTGTASLRRDYDWQTPRHLLTAAAPGVDERGRDRRLYAHGSRRFIHDDLAERATDVQQISSLRSRVVRGRSNVSIMRPGLRFTVRGHYRLDLEQEYLITELVHTGAEANSTHDAEAGEGYSNQFVCVPSDAVVRPPAQTPKPREYGPQTAIVTGPEGEEIHTDEYGRIQVQFHWEELPSYRADSSCWVRCSQSWAGMGWGAQFIPRIGMEVVVEFLEGNPDRPLVTGCVYNAEYPPPFVLPEHKTQSGWRTESSPGGGGSNELRFEDAAGDEEIYLHGEKDWTIEIENDKRQTVGHDERLRVENDRGKSVGNDEQFEIGHDQTGQVANDQTLSVGHDQQVTIAANRTETVGEAQKLDVGTTMDVNVGKSMTTTVGEAATTSIAKEHSVSVGGDASESVAGEKLVESKTAVTRTSEDMSFDVGKQLAIAADDNIDVKGQAEVVVEAADKMTFKCGDASIVLKKDGKILIKGKDVTVKGSGNVVIKGQKVAEN